MKNTKDYQANFDYHLNNLNQFLNSGFSELKKRKQAKNMNPDLIQQKIKVLRSIEFFKFTCLEYLNYLHFQNEKSKGFPDKLKFNQLFDLSKQKNIDDYKEFITDIENN